jgi:hypothetical protein
MIHHVEPSDCTVIPLPMPDAESGNVAGPADPSSALPAVVAAAQAVPPIRLMLKMRPVLPAAAGNVIDFEPPAELLHRTVKSLVVIV